MKFLAQANLANLDVNLRDNYGQTPTDYLTRRTILVEDDKGLHHEFNNLLQSTTPLSLGTSQSTIADDADLEHQPHDNDRYHLPGAYPIVSDLP